MIALPHGPRRRPRTGKLDRIKNRAKGQTQAGSTQSGARREKEFDSIEHLSAEAIAGYVDNELPPVAMNRARVHLVHCAECRAEVVAQRRASDRLRQAADESITVPSSLLDRLNNIAQSCPEGPAVDELAINRGETFVARVETFYRAVKRAQGK